MHNDNQPRQNLSRKKFLLWGAGLGSLLAVPAFLRSKKKVEKKETVKMLSQDGVLVEVDASLLNGKKEKLGEKGIHSFVRNKTHNL